MIDPSTAAGDSDCATSSNEDHQKIRVVLFTRSLERGGAETQLVSLAKELDRSQFDVTVVTFYAGGELDEELRSRGIPLVSLDKTGRWDTIGFGMRLVRQLRRLDPHVIHAYLDPPNLFAALAKPLINCTALVWGVRASDMELSRYDWTWRLVFCLERFFSFLPDAIIANSNAGRHHYTCSGFPDAKFRVIDNGIDVRRYVPDLSAGEQIRASWSVPPAASLIGLIARIDPMKDHSTFLHAASRLLETHPHVRFVCVGDGPDWHARPLRELAVKLGIDGRVSWVGHVRDMPAAYNALNLTTLCSAFGEGFPNAVGEAMATGVPCIVTDVGDARRIVGDDRFVVPRCDPEALATAWRWWLDLAPSAQRSFCETARMRAESAFSVDAMVARVAGVYRELAGSTSLGVPIARLIH